ncbi:hypothetical protein MMC14_007796 [Varicellaria rhodocarpa]|nr:hypothetical protein [Varicellaria rhodocarpa]
MPSAVVFGGFGQIARYLTCLLISKNYTVHSLIRDSSQSESLELLGAHPIIQSFSTATISELVSTIRTYDPDVVIWAAGAGANGYGTPSLHNFIDRDGAIKAMDAVAEAGRDPSKRRFIIISALDTRDRETRPMPSWYDDSDKAVSDAVWDQIPAYMMAKLGADKELVTGNDRRRLRYTIVRPNWLTVDHGSGKVQAGKISLKEKVSREDVAGVVMACIENEETIGQAFDVSGGGDMLIQEAVAQVGREKINVFEGYY